MTISYSFTRARSRPTFHNMMTRASKPDVYETDVSPKKMKIQKKTHRYLTQPDKSNAASERTFSKGNNIIGKILSVILSQWLHFPIYPGCNSFIQLESIH